MPLYDFECDRCGGRNELCVPYSERGQRQGVCTHMAACCQHPAPDSFCEAMLDHSEYHYCKGVTRYSGKLGKSSAQTPYTGIPKYIRRFRR